MQNSTEKWSDEILLVGFVGDDNDCIITKGENRIVLNEKQAVELAYTILNQHYGI